MRYLLFFICLISYYSKAQESNAFKTIQTNESYTFNDYVDASITSAKTENYYGSPIKVSTENYRINGINLSFETLDVSNIKHFKITVYSNKTDNNTNIPDAIVFEEEIHPYNYYCNQEIIDANTVNVDLFLQNPILLTTGNYWFTIVAVAKNETSPTVKIRSVHRLDYKTVQWDGNQWLESTIDIAHKLYGAINVQEIISTYPYTQSFGKEALDSWQMTDLFPEGILSFKVTDEIYAETDSNQSSIKMSSDYGKQVKSQLFYNLTSPKFRFLANRKYEVSLQIHHAVHQSGYRHAFIGLVYVPDPPLLGHLQSISNVSSGKITSDHNLDPQKSNSYFKKITYQFNPTTDVETRIAIHSELGAIPFGETVDLWFDEFKIRDVTNTLSVDIHQNLTSKIQVYPNPTRNALTIESITPIKKVSLFDITGRLIIESNKTKINTKNLVNGTYILQVVTEKGTFKKKIIKSN